jgi:hypothetical protein
VAPFDNCYVSGWHWLNFTGGCFNNTEHPSIKKSFRGAFVMRVTSKASFLFVKNPMLPGREEFILNPTGAEPATVPDWAKDDPTFKLAVADGNVIVVTAAKAVPKTPAEKAIADKAAADKAAADKAAADKAEAAGDKAAADKAAVDKAASGLPKA